MSIPERIGGSKAGGRGAADYLIILVILLAVTAAFGLGVLAGREMGEGKGDRLWIEELSTEARAQPAAVAAPAAAAATSGTYVASKSGTKYHLPSCSGAKRIKEENKVWFATKEAAEAAGYAPAANCPGL
ncbi:MAG TPA: Ada metal-binding domain-containing protein [Candidatus Paceibacterota bacterium]|nr:Ada metal-binding domain-containing protein [Candidatus Paceibacterota bacterium]